MTISRRTTKIGHVPTEDPSFFQNLVEKASEGILVHQNDRIVFANSCAVKLLGKSSVDELLGSSNLDYVHPRFRGVTSRRIREMESTGISVECIREVLVKGDGSYLEVELSSKPITLNDEPAVLVNFHESPDVERITRTLKRSEAMIAHANEEVYLADMSGRFIHVNNAVLDSLGYTLDELKTMKIQELDPLYETDELMDEHIQDQKAGNTDPFEVIHRTKDGTLKTKEVRSFYLDIDGDEFLCGFARDITALVKERTLTTAFTDISAAINSTLEFESIVDLLLTQSSSALKADSGIFILREGDHWRIPKAFGRLSSTLEGTTTTDDEARATTLSHETLEVIGVDDVTTDSRVNSGWHAARGIASYLVIPLVGAGKIVGSIGFFFDRPHSFDEAEYSFAKRLGLAGSLAVQNARIYEAEHENATILQEAQLVLPTKIKGIRFGTLYKSATKTARVGGDFFDIFEMRGNNVGIMIGDISGKGIRAATLTTLVKSTVKALAFEYSNPSEVLERANKVLITSFDSSSFATLIYGIMNTKTGEVTLAFAGHPPVLVKRASREVEIYEARSALLGAFPEVSCGKVTFTLSAGDSLFLYTDGMIEARGDDFDLFGVERLSESLANCKTKSVEEAPICLFEDAEEWAGGSLDDDCAILAVTLEV